MQLVGLLIPAGTVTFDRAMIYVSRPANVNGTIHVTTNATSTTGTASGSWGSTVSLVLYTQANSTSFASSTSATVAYGYTQSWSVSQSLASNSVSLTHSWTWGTGSSTGGGASSASTSGTTNTTSNYALGATSGTNMSGSIRMDIPWASSLRAGQYLIGLIGSSATATATGTAGLTVTVGAQTQTIFFATYSSARFKTTPDDAGNDFNRVRVGNTSVAGSTAPANINWLHMNVGSAVNVMSAPLLQLALLGAAT